MEWKYEYNFEAAPPSVEKEDENKEKEKKANMTIVATDDEEKKIDAEKNKENEGKKDQKEDDKEKKAQMTRDTAEAAFMKAFFSECFVYGRRLRKIDDTSSLAKAANHLCSRCRSWRSQAMSSRCKSRATTRCGIVVGSSRI